MKSTVMEKDLLRMVADKVLSEKSLIGWRTTDGELFPTANTGELVVFELGFSLPTNKFFRGLLHFYGIELMHLNPNSILQIAVFIISAKLSWALSPTLLCSATCSLSDLFREGGRLTLLGEPHFSFGMEGQTSIWVLL